MLEALASLRVFDLPIPAQPSGSGAPSPDQTALSEKLLGQDYEIITADDRLDKLAEDFVEHSRDPVGEREIDARAHR